jgi:hypothetical protein
LLFWFFIQNKSNVLPTSEHSTTFTIWITRKNRQIKMFMLGKRKVLPLVIPGYFLLYGWNLWMSSGKSWSWTNIFSSAVYVAHTMHTYFSKALALCNLISTHLTSCELHTSNLLWTPLCFDWLTLDILPLFLMII